MTSVPAPLGIAHRSGPYRGYAEAAASIALATVAGLAISPRWGNSAVDLIYLPAVLATAIIGGLRPALFSALGSALAYNYFFTAPFGTLRVSSPSDLVTVLMLFLVALVASHLAASVRKQAHLAQAHASRNATIAGLARHLLSCTEEKEIARVATRELSELFGCNAVMVARRPQPEVVGSAPASATLGPADIGAVALVLDSGEPAGRAVSRGSAAEWQFHPVRSSGAVAAAIGLARDDGAPPVAPEQAALVANLVDQIALALQRARIEAEARDFAASRAQDQLRSALLATIGQDLTPSVAGIAESTAQLRRSGSGQREVLSALAADASKLQRYIDNLADLELDADNRPIAAGDVTIDLFKRAVIRDGAEVHLPPKEYAVLAELARHSGRVLSHAHLLRTVWGPAQERQIDYLRVAIRGLRQKLERDPARPQLIINAPAVGYRLNAGLSSGSPFTSQALEAPRRAQ